jgi:hypothetical protein
MSVRFIPDRASVFKYGACALPMMLAESRFSMTSTTTCFQRGPGAGADEGGADGEVGAGVDATGLGGVVAALGVAGGDGVVLGVDAALEQAANSVKIESAAQTRAAIRPACPASPEPKLTGRGSGSRLP